ncbi:MAG: protein translocase subunit SecD [Planctomycetota bacterium]
MTILFTTIFLLLLVSIFVLYVLNQHWWKVSLIATVLFGALAMLWVPGVYTPQQRLNGGIDLVGGISLVYDVSVPEGRIGSDVVEKTIQVLSDRVDPTGTMNLVWRPVAGNRLEVQMALPPKEVRELRDQYDQALQTLKQGNITEGRLNAALRSEARVEQLTNLAAGRDALLTDLTGLADLYDQQQESKAPYDELSKLWGARQSEDSYDPASPTQEDIQTFTALEAAEGFYFDARDRFLDAEQKLLVKYAFNPADFRKIEDIPVVELSEERIAEGEITPRQQRLNDLRERFPARADQLDAAFNALVAYEKEKGPLDSAEGLIAILQGSGKLEFRISADPSTGGFRNYMEALDNGGPRANADAEYRWFEIDNLEQFVDDDDRRETIEGLLRDSSDVDDAVRNQAVEAVTANFQNSYVIRPYAGRLYMLLHNTSANAIFNDGEWSVTGVRPTTDETGKPAVRFNLDAEGGSRMATLTGPNVGRPMAILLDDNVLTSPNIRGRLSTGISITGSFSNAEVDYIVKTMDAGSLEGQLSDLPVSRKTTGPQLGADNLKAGLQAAIFALIAVAIFMVLYYFFAGAVANFALAANMLLILGIMATIQSTFTLPGIAGLVLTIGMAVDANVLIFERIREELMDKKAALEVAVRQGYGKALSTIIDANITTMITCVILGYTASSDVKGFAVVLGIGILATMFTALFCTKVILDLWVRYRGGESLAMLPTVVPGLHRLFSPNVDWLAKAKYLVPISALLLVLGLAEAFNRGADMLDIEFRSGTQVSFELKATGEQDAAGNPVLMSLPMTEVRDRLEFYGKTAAAIQADEPLDAEQQAVAEPIREIIARAQERYDEAFAEYEQKARQGVSVDEPDPVPDFGRLAEAQVVTTGENADGINASGFSIAALITDSTALTDMLQELVFKGDLDTTQRIGFDGEEMDDAAAARRFIRAIDGATLGEVFGGEDGASDLPAQTAARDISEFRGGVAIMVTGMDDDPLSLAQVEARLARMRLQPPHTQLGAREYQVFEYQRAEDAFDDEGNPLLTGVIIVASDGSTNYETAPDSLLNGDGLADTEWALVKDALTRETSFSDVTVFNSQVSGTMQQQVLVAMFLSLLAVIAYIWLRFGSIRYGLAAIAALVHDVSIALGLVALAGWFYDQLGPNSAIVQLLMLDPFKVNIAMVAAFLTIVGYSLNDTIVVFDRIRENRGRLSRATPQIINQSINQTISRTVLTSGTTFIAVFILYAFGGPGVHGFAFAMLLGIFIGTYSSIAIASPILLFGFRGKGGKPGASPAKTDDPDPDIASEPAVV